MQGSGGISIRDAALEDLAAIVEIYNASIPGRMATADTAPVTVESRRPWFYQHTPLRRPLWVAETPAGVSGWLAFSSFYGGRPAYDATAEVSLYVSPSAQRQGIGRRLLTEAIQKSPSLGLTALLYQAFAHNVPSVTLATATAAAARPTPMRISPAGSAFRVGANRYPPPPAGPSR